MAATCLIVNGDRTAGFLVQRIAWTGFDTRRIFTVLTGHGQKQAGDLWILAHVGLQQPNGNCTDFHSLFMSLMRSRNIPTRFEIGFSIPTEQSGTIDGYHCWAWFLANRTNWVPVDISEADKHPELTGYYFGKLTVDRITISQGRDIPLLEQPETKLNYFVYPYVEADGKPIPNQNIQLDISYENF